MAFKARHAVSDKYLKNPRAGGEPLVLLLKHQEHLLDQVMGRPEQNVQPGHLGRSAAASLGNSQQHHWILAGSLGL